MNKVKIFGTIRSRANRCVWAAEETGVPYELVPIDIAKGDQRSAEYMAINPNARVPALEDGALRLYESLAINLYLAKKAGGELAPKDLAEDAKMTMWALWTMTELEKHALDVLFHTALYPPDKRDPAAVATALAALERPMKVLDAALAANGHLVGGRFTMADLNAAVVTMYLRGAPKEYHAKFPHVGAWVTAATQRAAYRKAMGGH